MSGVATRTLANPDADDLAIIGSGTQARTHLAAMLAVRPVRKVRAWSPTRERLEAFVARRVIQVHSVILANLVLGENVVPEFLQEFCTADALADALTAIVRDGPERRRQVEAFASLDAILEIGSAEPSTRAADVVGAMLDQRGAFRR